MKRLCLLLCLAPLWANAQLWDGLDIGFSQRVRCFYADTVADILYIGGNFSHTDDYATELRGFARYDGDSLYPIGSGDTACPGLSSCQPIFDFERYQDQVFACGFFNSTGVPGTEGIAAWDGTQWHSMAGGIQDGGGFWQLVTYQDKLVAIGSCQTLGAIEPSDNCNLAAWDGTQWECLYGNEDIGIATNAMVYNNELYIGGNFDTSDGLHEIFKWNGSTAEPVGGGILGDSYVGAMAVYKGELYVGGKFTKAEGNAGNYIMRWDGQQWHEVGGGMDGLCQFSCQVSEMIVFNNELYVGGQFLSAGGVPVTGFAKWDGAQWCGLGTWFQDDMPTAFGVYRNELYLNVSNVEGQDVGGFCKWIGGNHTDSCGVLVAVPQPAAVRPAFRVAQNPVKHTLVLQASGPAMQPTQLTVLNTMGQVVATPPLIATGAASWQVDLRGLPSGVYLLRIQASDGAHTVRVVKE